MKRNGHEKYNVHLTVSQRQEIETLTRKGTHPARVITRAGILLAAAEGKQDKEICQRFGVMRSTVPDVRKPFYEEGLSRALYDLPRPGQPRKRNGKQEAKVVAMACTKAPKGYDHWTRDLLTEEVNNQGMEIGRTAVWKILLRNNTKPWRKKMWGISKITPEFEKKMNDGLEVYARPYDPPKPVVCLDEKSKPLLKETRQPIATKPGKVAKTDYEYERNDTCNIFVAVEPKGNKRTVRVTRHRAGKDWASFIKYLVRHVYKRIKKLGLIEDKLNPHNKETLIEHRGEEGRRMARKIEWHDTPKHASGFDQAEIEIPSRERQCLNRRIPDFHTMPSEVAAGGRRRNRDKCGINWQFTREKAKKKFHLA